MDLVLDRGDVAELLDIALEPGHLVLERALETEVVVAPALRCVLLPASPTLEEAELAGDLLEEALEIRSLGLQARDDIGHGVRDVLEQGGRVRESRARAKLALQRARDDRQRRHAPDRRNEARERFREIGWRLHAPRRPRLAPLPAAVTPLVGAEVWSVSSIWSARTSWLTLASSCGGEMSDRSAAITFSSAASSALP